MSVVGHQVSLKGRVGGCINNCNVLGGREREVSCVREGVSFEVPTYLHCQQALT